MSAPTQVDFYILAESALEAKHRYACRIANKAFSQGMKVYMRTDNADTSRVLDKLLWTFSQSSFVPHAICEQGAGDSARFPVQIGHDDAPMDCADLLIALTEKVPPDYANFGRVAELIINQDADKSAGRKRFRFYREQGIEPQSHNIK